MSESDLPVESGPANDTALSIDDGAAAIEGLLSADPAKDLPGEVESQNEGQDKQLSPRSEASAADVSEGDSDDDLDLEDEGTSEGEAGPRENAYEAGRFAADDANVTLPDGRVTTVAELKRNTFFQKDYTQKLEGVKQEKEAVLKDRETFEAERSQFADTLKQVEQQRNLILTVASKLLPKEPQPVDPNTDPMGYMQYQYDREAYMATMGELQTLWNATQQEQTQLTERQKQEQQKQQEQLQEQYKAALAAEQQRMFEVLPRLKDENERKKFFNEAVEVGKFYGLKPEEIDSIADHRYLRVLADAMAFRKAVAKRDAAKQPQPAQPQTQQPRIPPRQRMAPTTPQARDQGQAFDRLRKTGSREDAARALEKFV